MINYVKYYADLGKQNAVTDAYNKSNATPTQQAVPASTNTTSPTYNPIDQINALKQAQKNQSIISLASARDKTLSNLKAEKKEIAPQYYNQRSNASTGSQLQAKNFAEYMAQRGQSNAGASGQAELARNVALQGTLGNLQTAEANAFADNARRVSDVNNAFNDDVVAAQAGIEAQSMQQLINQMNADRAFNYQAGRDTITDTRESQRYTDQLKQQQFNNSMAQAQFDFEKKQAEISNAVQQGQLSIQQGQLAIAQANQELQSKQQELDNAFRQTQFDTSTDQWNRQFDNANNQWNAEYNLNRLNADRNYNLNAQQASQSSSANTAKQLQSDYNQYLDIGLNLKNSTLTNADGGKVRQYEDDQIANWLKGLDLPTDYKIKLANTLGLEPKSENPYYNLGGYSSYAGAR
jgi:hypothetical protein